MSKVMHTPPSSNLNDKLRAIVARKQGQQPALQIAQPSPSVPEIPKPHELPEWVSHEPLLAQPAENNAPAIYQLEQAIAALTERATLAARAEMRLEEALSRATKASPETITMLSAEKQRLLQEVQSLQAELERCRRALRMVAGGGMRAFYRRMGQELSEISETALDLFDSASGIGDGKVSTDIGKRIAAFLRSVGEIFGEYADNCMAYAEEEIE